MLFRFDKIFFLLVCLLFTFSTSPCESSKKIVAVMPVNISANYDEKIADIMENHLTRVLYESNNYTVVERTKLAQVLRELGFQMTGATDPNQSVQVGKMLGAQYSVLGQISVFELEDNGEKNILSNLFKVVASQSEDSEDVAAANTVGSIFGLNGKTSANKFEAKLAVDIKFVNNETGEIVLATQVSGEKGSDTSESAINEVCKAAAENFLREIRQRMPIFATVIDVEGYSVYLDMGIESGLHDGDILEIYREGSPITDMSGKIIAVKKTLLGKIQIQSAQSNYSVAQIIEVFSNEKISRGDSAKKI